MASRWAAANNPSFYLVLRVVPGYASCSSQPDGWHEYAPNVGESQVPGQSYSISPGYWKAGEATPQMARKRGIVFDDAIERMVASEAPFQLITSWNRWDEGTSVEPATSWVHPSCIALGRRCTGIYLNRLHKAVPETVVSAAGDIACDPGDPSWNGGNGVADPVNGACRQKFTANLLAGSDAVLALGDTQYEPSSTANYDASFNATWGAFKSIIHPTPGDHEYQVPGAADYFSYFGSAAGEPGNGYYSFDLGSWHVVSLNSNCNAVSCAKGSPQELWLIRDLWAHRFAQCTLAFTHFPHFTDGPHVADETGSTQALWDDLYAFGAELMLNGNDHSYQRFAPKKPDGTNDPSRGIRAFIVGTGGKSFTTPQGTTAELRHPGSFGVLRLKLYAQGYTWQFVPEAGDSFTDSGTGDCH
jgi:hypothetical protein